MNKLDNYGDVERVSISATTAEALLEISKINAEAYIWLSTTVIRMYRFGEEPDTKEVEEAFDKFSETPILPLFIKTILDDSRRWSIQGRAGISAGAKGGKASAAKRKKKAEPQLSNEDIKAQKAAKALSKNKYESFAINNSISS